MLLGLRPGADQPPRILDRRSDDGKDGEQGSVGVEDQLVAGLHDRVGLHVAEVDAVELNAHGVLRELRRRRSFDGGPAEGHDAAAEAAFVIARGAEHHSGRTDRLDGLGVLGFLSALTNEPAIRGRAVVVVGADDHGVGHEFDSPFLTISV